MAQCAAVLLGLSLIGPAAQQAYAADTVHLRNGTVLEGEVVENEKNSKEIVLDTGLKTLRLFRSEIRQLNVDTRTRQLYAHKVNLLAKPTAQDRFQLYKWCQANRLYSLAEKELQATVEADPHHELARKALGHIYRDGQWLTKEQAARLPAEQASLSMNEDLFISEAADKAQETREKQVAFNRAVVEHARTLGQSTPEEKAKQEALTLLLRERTAAAPVLLGCLNFRRFADSEIRLGALKGMRVVNPTGPRLSDGLAWSAVMDPAEDVRDEAVKLIKERKDDKAIGGMIRHLVGAFDKGGQVRNPKVRDAAITALRAMGDTRIGEALLYYVTMELRVTATELVDFQTRQIDSFTVQQGGNVIIPILLSFPVQFPELSITKVRTTVCAPASALRAYTGQNFGDDFVKWRKFVKGFKGN